MKLAFGYNAGLPDDALAAWGARIIVTQDGDVDIVWDRTDSVPEGNADMRRAFLDLLNERYPTEALRAMIRALLQTREIDTRVAREVGLYDDDEIRVIGNSNGSGGYFYVTAYLKASNG